MKINTPSQKNKILKSYINLFVGSLCTALALNLFLIPNNLAPGGVSGLATVLYKTVGINVSLTVFSANAVLLIAGFKFLKKLVLIKSILATVIMSVLIEALAFLTPLSLDPILSAVIGGALMGLGTGLTVTAGGSTGGTDLAALILNRFFPQLGVARLILIVDSFVILLSGVAFKNYEIMLYSALALFIASKVADNLIEGVNFALMIYIISSESKAISKSIIEELNHGVTAVRSTGVYTNTGYNMLICAIRKNEFVQLKRIVKAIDKNAFIILTDARSVYGKGFNYY